MQTSHWPQNGLGQSFAGQSQSSQVNNGKTSGTYSHQYGPVRPPVPSTLGPCLPRTNGGHWGGQTLNQQSSMFHLSQPTTTKQKVIMASNPKLLSLLTNNNEAAQFIDSSQSGSHQSLHRRVNSAVPYTFQQENVSLGGNNNNSQRLGTDGKVAAHHSTTYINAQQNASVNNLQKPVAGSQQMAPGRQGPSASLAMGRSQKKVNCQWTVFSGQDSTRISVQVPNQGHTETPTSLQSAQETHNMASGPSSMSPTDYIQLLGHIFQNQNNISRTEFNWVQHGERVNTGPSNQSQIFPPQPLTGINNQVNVANSAVGQLMPTHSHNLLVPNHLASRFIATTQEHNRTGATGNNAQHVYGRPYMQGTGHTMRYKADATYVQVPNSGPSSSVPNNGVQSSIQRTPDYPPPPYPGQHSHGQIRNKTGHAVRVEAPSLQNVPNPKSIKPMQYKKRNAYDLKPNTEPSSSVPNHCMQFSGQQNCESILPSYPIRQGYYITVPEDKSGNGFGAGNVLFFVGDKRNESASVLQGSTASNVLQKAIAVVQPLSPCMQKNTPIDRADKIPLTTQGMSLSTGGDVSNHGEDSCGHPSRVRTPFTNSTSLTDKQEVPKSRPEDASESGSEKVLTQEAETSDFERAMTHSSFEYEMSQSNCLRTEEVDSQPSSNFECQATQSNELSDIEVTTLRHVNPLNEETNEQVVLDEDMYELASVPVMKWTLGKLKDLIEIIKPKECSATLVENKIINLYWEGDGEKLMEAQRSNGFQNILEDVRSVCSDCDMSPQSVILSQVRYKNWAKVWEKCDILRHGSVYSRLPEHKSLWLNTNEQLDDIDKEFGFPWSLLYGQYSLQREDEVNPMCTENEKSADLSSNVPTEELIPIKRPTSSESDAKETEGSVLAHCSTQTTSPVIQGESNGFIHNDPFSSLVINVLPPEEAMRFFSDRVLQDKVEDEETIELAEEMDVKMIDLKNDSLEDMSSKGVNGKFMNNDVEMEDYCCLSRWMAVFSGSSLSSCNCQNKTKLVSAKETVNAEDLSKTNGTMEGIWEKNKGENEKPELAGVEEAHTIVLSDSGSETDGPYTDTTRSLDSSEDPPVSLINRSNIVEVEIEDVFSNYEDFLKVAAPMSELVWDNVEPKQKDLDLPMKNMECVQEPDTLEEGNPGGGEAIPTVTNSDFNQLRQQTNKISFLSSLSLAHRIPKHRSPKRNHICKVKQKRVGLKRRCFESPHSKLSVSGKRRKIKDCFGPNPELIPEGNLTETNVKFEPPYTTTPKSFEEERPSKRRALQKPTEPGLKTKIWKASTVSLALFGTTPKTKNETAATSLNKHHNSSRPRHFSDKALAPPETLSVNVNFWKTEPYNTRTLVEAPVKHRILNEWKSSFVPTKSKGRVLKLQYGKRFAPKVDGYGVATVATDPKNVLSCKRRVTTQKTTLARTVNNKQTLRDIERERILNGLRLQLKRCKPEIVPSSKCDALEKSKYEMGNPAEMPLEENSVLRFSVLPKSFNFKDGQEPMDTPALMSSMKEITDPVTLETESPETTVHKSQGAWSVCPQKNPVQSTTIKGTTNGTKFSSTLFQEFQKKFKQKN
ncbi:uncharacterized protein si:ch211-106e7.2 [Esox lucius]|uniref:uncharacterized protein si:ch211-106e7.2 n=1 Tax=Esox lucius TaxID=8010 RepID=UPI0014772AA7|nr:uncharacterized protein si:ch211-106e7.2 [Esox lucius]